MINYNLAIEVGTSNTVIYKAGAGVVLKEPTLIAFSTIGKKKTVCCVGGAAKKLIGKTNNTTEIIAPIFEGAINNFNACSVMLKEFLNKVAPSGIFKQKNKVVFIIPCGLTYEEKQKFTMLAYSLNINVVAILPAVVCGLIGMEVEENDPHSHMIISIGGGITDVAIVNNNHIIRGASINVGGASIDYNIQSLLLNDFGVKVESVTCEDVKNQVGSLMVNDISSVNVIGVENITKSRKEIRIMSTDIYPVISSAFNKIIEASEAILNMCSSEVLKDIGNLGIYVCGGLSNITGVEQYLSKNLKLPVFIDVEPDSSVIMGAGNLLNNPILLNSLLIKK